MASPSQIYVVLPAYNEEAALRILLPHLYEELSKLGIKFTLCVVDDASTDATPELLKRLSTSIPIQALRHTVNQNYGAAVKTGVLWVVQHGLPNDVMVLMDADNTHSPAYIPSMLQKIQEDYDVVTASYTGEGAGSRGVPPLRRLFSEAANALLRLRFHFPHVKTYTNGYRVYRVAALQNAYSRYGERVIQEANFAGGTELFTKTVRCGGRPAEVPFILDYEKRGTASKINIPRTIASYLRLLIR
jgi:dolichol-phosphate mannosyltransferase